MSTSTSKRGRESSIDELSEDFVKSLCKRVESFLPSITGYSLTEVELNPQFIITKNLIIDNVSCHPDYITLVMFYFCKILNSINKDSNELKLKDRDDKVLSSTLLILKILIALIEKSWKGLVINTSSVNSGTYHFNTYNNFEIVNTFTFHYQFDVPAPLNYMNLNYILDTLIELMSNDIIRFALKAIQTHPIDDNKYYHNSNPPINLNNVLVGQQSQNSHINNINLNPNASSHNFSSINVASDLSALNISSSPGLMIDDGSIDSAGNSINQTMFSNSTNQSDFEVGKLINDIDLHIEVCLRFISASSSQHYFLYLYEKLFRFNDRNEPFTFYGLLRYSPLIKYQFYSDKNGLSMAKAINRTLMNLKNSTWKQILLLFYSQSIRDQALARPEDYKHIVLLGGEIASVCKSIFEQTNSIFDDLPYSGVISMVQSWISTLIPSDYKEFESGPNKLKMNFNKRLKFINSLIKDSNGKLNLTSFDCLITLFHLAARFPPSMHDHPIYLFSLNFVDITFKNLIECDLSKFSSHLEAPSGERVKRSYDNLIVNFFVAAIILKPQKYIDMYINKFHDIKDSFRDVRIIVKILRKLTDLSISFPYYHQIMEALSSEIKALTFNVAKMLNQRYDSSIGSINSYSTTTTASSSGSLHSDKGSVHSQTAQRKMSFDRELSPPSSKMLNYHHGQTSQQLFNPFEINYEQLKFTTATFSGKSSNTKSMYNLEDLLADLFTVFRYSAVLFFNDFSLMNEDTFYSNEDANRKHIAKFIEHNVDVLRIGLQSRSINNNASILFNCTGDLIMTIVDRNNDIFINRNKVSAYANFMTWKQIIKVICDSCLSLSLRDSRFKSSMVFLNKFLNKRDEFQGIIEGNTIIEDPKSHTDEPLVGNSIERVLLLSLCTHDIQFYNITKETMRWHVKQIGIVGLYFPDNLQETFRQIIDDDSVFTGFVSLHKRFRNILRGAAPTKALYQVWLIIYERWNDVLQNKNSLNEDNLLFRHFTGFLVSTSGCFLTDDFAVNDPELKTRLEVYMSAFFDKCIELLTSQDLVIRVIVKDAISNETHSAVYHMVSKKLTEVVKTFEENRSVDEESVLFTEQAIMIITVMISIPNDGSILLTASLPEICTTLIQVINMVDDPMNQLRLKLRFCKLVITIEENRERLLIAGAYRIRNLFAKGVCDWLEQSAFHEELSSNISSVQRSSSTNSHNSSNHSKNPVKDSELAYINIDLATESSKALSLQLEELILEIPDGTLEQDVSKYKDLAFANYFSLFYKILTKYTSSQVTPVKSKYKVQLVVDNVLKCITNLLQYDTDIGLQFVFPLGYHENKKIRALFLSVFADMLYERKVERGNGLEYANINELSEIVDIVRAASVIASTHNQNLYASAVFGVYGYLKQLDVVFELLLAEEIQNVSRTSDIFRRNSILTKLLAKLAKDYGLNYLTTVLKDFVLEFTTKEIIFNVDKEHDDHFNPDLFMTYLNKLVDLIVNSKDYMPDSFKYICSQIYKQVCAKVPDSGLIAVGSFIFLRFFCPAIISPESFFGIDVIDHQNKKSLLQLVKVIQNMANKTLSVLKWKGLNSKSEELEEINKKIFVFLEEISSFDSKGKYPFEVIEELPVPELRYNHKFFFTYYKEIKQKYLLGDLSPSVLSKRVAVMKKVDKLLKEAGQPKALLALHGSDNGSGYKSFDPTGTLSSEYTDFMNKMSAEYAERVLEVPLIHNAIFYDGTPVVVVNLYALKTVNFDVKLLIFKLFETASQVWDNKFYFIFDFTGFSSELHLLVTYATLLNTYGPPQLFKNCTRIYYFNLPIKDISAFFGIVKPSNVSDKETRAKFYTYSHCDSNDIISSLCLSDETMAITRDKKVEFNNCKVLNSRTHEFFLASVRIGRQFLLICSNEFVPTNHELCATSGFRPVEIFMLSDISRCEVTKYSGANDEFTIFFNNNQNIIIRSHERLEVLRFLFFTTSRLPKALVEDDDKELHNNDISTQWFGRLFNIVFQSLLCDHDDVKSAASLLLASVSNYFEIGFSIARDHAKNIAYPENITDFIVSISEHLAKEFPEMTYRFFRAFFDCHEKLPKKHRMDAILYISPWIPNICDHVYLEDEQLGPDRVAGIIRQLCLVSALSEETISATNDYIWKKLFSESILTPILLDEIVTFVMDNRNDDPEWSFIISIITPSVELCGETIKRLIECINEAYDSDSEIASESKLFEIMILVKICSSLFFDSYVFAQLFLADIFFICTLFIDNPSLEFGADLQKLVINTIQSFFNKPDLTEEERNTVDSTLKYFSGQRAKMLFGLTRERTSGVSDITQLYNRAGSFETLCDYLNDFISVLGSADDRAGWRSRWSSYAMDVAFATGSLFQVRAILVVGILAKTGISDHTTSKVLKLMSGPAFSPSMEYMTNILMSSARMFKGLSHDSVFPSIIIWPEIYLGMLNYSSLYQASIQCLLNTMIMNLEQGVDYLDRIFLQRKHLAPFIDAVEKAHGFHIDKRNFLCYIFFIFTQGLKLSHIKHTSLECLKQVFKERYVIHQRDVGKELPGGLQPYLYFIWLSCNEESFEEFIQSTDYTPPEYHTFLKLSIPKLTLEFLLMEDIYSILTLYHAAYLYATPTVESGFKTRFLYSLKEIAHRKPEKGKRIFHIIRTELENTLIDSNSIDVVSIASEIMLMILNDKTYSMKEQEKITDDFLNEHGLMIMKNYKFRKLQELLAEDENAKERIKSDNEKLQEMIYRSASSYVENEKLEN